MAFLYQPPQSPYRGLETGLASNVYCENVNTLFNAVNTPVATTGDNVPAATPTGIQLKTTAGGIFGWDIPNSIMESRTSVPVINTAATGETLGTGTGMTVKLRYHPPLTNSDVVPVVGTDVGWIAVVIDNPGTGYKAGDRVSVTSANAQLIFALNTFVQNLDDQTTTKLENVDGKKPMTVVIPGGAVCGITFTLSTTTSATSYDELVCSAQGTDGGVQMQLSGANYDSNQFNSNEALASVTTGAVTIATTAITDPVVAGKPVFDLQANLRPTTNGGGSGFACTITLAAANTAAQAITSLIITGGSGYLPGDTITYTKEQIQAGFRATAGAAPIPDTSPATTIGGSSIVFTLKKENFASFMDWIPSSQFSDNFVMQIVKVHFPQPSISSDDYDKIDDTYTCTSNVTSSRNHLAITSIAGFVTNALDADTGSDGTEDGSSGGKLIVSLIRYAPPGFSLAAGILNCRIGKRQNPASG